MTMKQIPAIDEATYIASSQKQPRPPAQTPGHTLGKHSANEYMCDKANLMFIFLNCVSILRKLKNIPTNLATQLREHG